MMFFAFLRWLGMGFLKHQQLVLGFFQEVRIKSALVRAIT